MGSPEKAHRGPRDATPGPTRGCFVRGAAAAGRGQASSSDRVTFAPAKHVLSTNTGYW